MKAKTGIIGVMLIALMIFSIIPSLPATSQNDTNTSTTTNTTTTTTGDDVLELINRVSIIINNSKLIGIPTDDAELLLQQAITLYYNGDIEGARQAAISALESLGVSMALFGLSSENQTSTNQTQTTNQTGNQTTTTPTNETTTTTTTPTNQTQTGNQTTINQTISQYIQGLLNMTYEERLQLLITNVEQTLDSLEAKVQSLTSLSDQEKQVILQKIDEIRQLLNEGKVFQAVLELKRVMKAVHEYIEEENKLKLKLYLKLKLEKDDILKLLLNTTDGNNTLAKFGKEFKKLLKELDEDSYDPKELAKLLSTAAVLKHMIKQTNQTIMGNMLGNMTFVEDEDVLEDLEEHVEKSVLLGYGYNGSLLVPVETLLDRAESLLNITNATMIPMFQQTADLILEQINVLREAVNYTKMAIQAYNNNDTDAFYNYLTNAKSLAKSAKEALDELDKGVFKAPAKMGEAAGEILLKIIERLEKQQYLLPPQASIVLKGVITSVGNGTLTVWGTIFAVGNITGNFTGYVKMEHEMLPAPAYWTVIINNDTKIIGTPQELAPVLVIGVYGDSNITSNTISAKLIKVGAAKEVLKSIDDIIEEHWDEIEEISHETHHGHGHDHEEHGSGEHHGVPEEEEQDHDEED